MKLFKELVIVFLVTFAVITLVFSVINGTLEYLLYIHGAR